MTTKPDVKKLLEAAVENQRILVDRANEILKEGEKLSEERQIVIQEALRLDGEIRAYSGQLGIDPTPTTPATEPKTKVIRKKAQQPRGPGGE